MIAADDRALTNSPDDVTVPLSQGSGSQRTVSARVSQANEIDLAFAKYRENGCTASEETGAGPSTSATSSSGLATTNGLNADRVESSSSYSSVESNGQSTGASASRSNRPGALRSNTRSSSDTSGGAASTGESIDLDSGGRGPSRHNGQLSAARRSISMDETCAAAGNRTATAERHVSFILSSATSNDVANGQQDKSHEPRASRQQQQPMTLPSGGEQAVTTITEFTAQQHQQSHHHHHHVTTCTSRSISFAERGPRDEDHQQHAGSTLATTPTIAASTAGVGVVSRSPRQHRQQLDAKLFVTAAEIHNDADGVQRPPEPMGSRRNLSGVGAGAGMGQVEQGKVKRGGRGVEHDQPQWNSLEQTRYGVRGWSPLTGVVGARADTRRAASVLADSEREALMSRRVRSCEERQQLERSRDHRYWYPQQPQQQQQQWQGRRRGPHIDPLRITQFSSYENEYDNDNGFDRRDTDFDSSPRTAANEPRSELIGRSSRLMVSYPTPSSGAYHQLTVPGHPTDPTAFGHRQTRSVDRQDTSATRTDRWTDTRQTRSLETASRTSFSESTSTPPSSKKPVQHIPVKSPPVGSERRMLPAVPQTKAPSVARTAYGSQSSYDAARSPSPSTHSRRQMYGMAAITNRSQQRQQSSPGLSEITHGGNLSASGTAASTLTVTNTGLVPVKQPVGDNSFDSVPTDYDASDTTSRSRSGDPVTTTSIESSSSLPGCGTTATTVGGIGSSSSMAFGASNNCSIDTEDSTDKSGAGTSGGHRLHQMRDDSGYKSLETQQSLGKAAAGVVTAAAWVERIRSRSMDARQPGQQINSSELFVATQPQSTTTVQNYHKGSAPPFKFSVRSPNSQSEDSSNFVDDSTIDGIRKGSQFAGSSSLLPPMSKINAQSLTALFSRPVWSKSYDKTTASGESTAPIVIGVTSEQAQKSPTTSTGQSTAEFRFFEKFALQTHTVGRVLTSGFDRIRQQAENILSKTTPMGAGSLSVDASSSGFGGDKLITGSSIGDKPIASIHALSVDTAERKRSLSAGSNSAGREVVSCSNLTPKLETGVGVEATSSAKAASILGKTTSTGISITTVPRSAIRVRENTGNSGPTSIGGGRPTNRQCKEVDFILVESSTAGRDRIQHQTSGNHLSSGERTGTGSNINSGKVASSNLTKPASASSISRSPVAIEPTLMTSTKHAYSDPSGDFRRGSAKTASKKRRDYRSRKQIDEVHDTIRVVAATQGGSIEQASSSSVSQVTTSTGSGNQSGEPSSSENSIERPPPLGIALLGSSTTSDASSSASYGTGTDPDVREDAACMTSQRRRAKLGSGGRDYSIDAKTDALFNEFLKYDPSLDGGATQRDRRKNSVAGKELTVDRKPKVVVEEYFDEQCSTRCGGGSGISSLSRRTVRSKSASFNDPPSSGGVACGSRQLSVSRADTATMPSTYFGSIQLSGSIEEEDENTGD